MSVISSCRSAERGGGQVEDLAPAQHLELTLRLQQPLGSALEGHEGRLPVQLVFAASASRLQMTARVGLDSPPSIAHATATTIAAPRRLEGSRTPQHDELRVLQHVKKTCSSPFPQRNSASQRSGNGRSTGFLRSRFALAVAPARASKPPRLPLSVAVFSTLEFDSKRERRPFESAVGPSLPRRGMRMY